jgi:hypothetical protein
MRDYVSYLTDTASCFLPHDSSMKIVFNKKQLSLLENFYSPKKYRVDTNIKLTLNKWKPFNL